MQDYYTVTFAHFYVELYFINLYMDYNRFGNLVAVILENTLVTAERSDC